MIAFWNLLKMESMLVLKNVKDSLINNVIFCGLIAMVSGYILNAFGTSEYFAALQSASLIVSSIGFEVYRSIFRLLSDIEGDKHIQYYFSLPIPNVLVFVNIICSFVVNGMVFATSSLFILRVVLPQHIILANINYAMFLLTVVVISVFFGSFSIFLTAYTKSMMKVSNTLMRILFPIWIVGGFQFSYSIAKSISPILGYITLISPYTYANEAMRYVVIGSSNFINIWISLSVLSCLSVLVFVLSMKKLRKRLDFM